KMLSRVSARSALDWHCIRIAAWGRECARTTACLPEPERGLLLWYEKMNGNLKRAAIVSLALGALVSSAELLRTGASAGVESVLARTLLAEGDGVRIVRSFPGNKGPGWKDSIDVAGAVGPRHVVSFDVAGFVVHDKASGR